MTQPTVAEVEELREGSLFGGLPMPEDALTAYLCDYWLAAHRSTPATPPHEGRDYEFPCWRCPECDAAEGTRHKKECPLLFDDDERIVKRPSGAAGSAGTLSAEDAERVKWLRVLAKANENSDDRSIRSGLSEARDRRANHPEDPDMSEKTPDEAAQFLVDLCRTDVKDWDAVRRIIAGTLVSAYRAGQANGVESMRRWVDGNTTFYDVDERFPVKGGNVPTLASVSKRIWYHATDDQISYPFSAVIDAARKFRP